MVDYPRGPKGAKGDPGPQGPRGNQGPKGDKGDTGDVGPQGIQGPQGLQGTRGVKGDPGAPGGRGPQGDQGLQGLQGPTGLQGIPGSKGNTGAKGDQGPQGDVGPAGPRGFKGVPGDPGAKGDKGDPGASTDLATIDTRIQEVTRLGGNNPEVDSNGSLNMKMHGITYLPAPNDPLEAANKQYVDSKTVPIDLVGNLPDVPAIGVTKKALPIFRQKLSEAQRGVGNCRILTVGDSTTLGVGSSGHSYPQVLSELIDGTLAPHSRYSLDIPQEGGNDNRWTPTGDWGFFNFTAFGAGWGGRGYYRCNRAGSGTLTYTSKVAADGLKVYYLFGGENPEIPVTIDGIAVELLDTKSGTTGGWSSKTYQVPLGTHTIVFGSPGGPGTGDVWITGVELLDSTQFSVDIANAGVGGSTSVSWYDTNIIGKDDYTGGEGIRYFAPDLTIIMLGINDAGGALPASYVVSNLQHLIDKAKISGDVILMSTIPGGAPYTTTEVQYESAFKELAKSNAIPFVDIFTRYGTNEAALAAGYAIDTIGHFNASGYADLASAVYEVLSSVVDIPSIVDTRVSSQIAPHYMRAVIDTPNGGTPAWLPNAGAFVTVPVILRESESTDLNNWSIDDHTWEIPVSGVYSIAANLRVTDGATPGLNIGFGVDVSNQDSAAFYWQTTSTALRTTFIYSRTQHFTAGDRVRFFAYIDSNTQVTFANGSLGLVLVSRDA